MLTKRVFTIGNLKIIYSQTVHLDLFGHTLVHDVTPLQHSIPPTWRRQLYTQNDVTVTLRIAYSSLNAPFEHTRNSVS